jgi:hypothetical protein
VSVEIITGFGGAFIGAILTAILAWFLNRGANIAAKKEELRNAIMSILDLRMENFYKVPSIEDPILREATSLNINTKRVMLLQVAEMIVEQIPRHISPAEYATLAYEIWLESDFDTASKYYQRIITASGGGAIARSAGLRAAASYYFAHTPHRNPDTSRKLYQKAINILRKSSDEYSLYSIGLTYEWWGLTARSQGLMMGDSGLLSEGNEKVALARTTYEALSKWNTLRTQSLESLDRKLKQQDTTLSTGGTPPPPSTQFHTPGLTIPQETASAP